VDPQLLSTLMRSDGPMAALSDREREVLRLMAEGLSDRGIAERLVVSPQTAYAHVHHVFTKLELPGSPAGNRRVRAVIADLAARPG